MILNANLSLQISSQNFCLFVEILFFSYISIEFIVFFLEILFCELVYSLIIFLLHLTTIIFRFAHTHDILYLFNCLLNML